MHTRKCQVALCLLGLLPAVAIAKPIAFAMGTTDVIATTPLAACGYLIHSTELP